MISARKLYLLSVPAIAAISLTAGTGVAVADDDSYLAQIHKIGLTGDKDTLIQLGHLICADRSAGETPDQLAQVVQSKTRGSASVTRPAWSAPRNPITAPNSSTGPPLLRAH